VVASALNDSRTSGAFVRGRLFAQNAYHERGRREGMREEAGPFNFASFELGPASSRSIAKAWSRHCRRKVFSPGMSSRKKGGGKQLDKSTAVV